MKRDVVAMAARDVRPGDQIWDKHMYMRDKWVTIRQVWRTGETVWFCTGTGPRWTSGSGITYGLDAREGVGVRRRTHVQY